ncbi:MAG: chromate transporter [bacterium]|nr:chromate transporter [bacterium]
MDVRDNVKSKLDLLISIFTVFFKIGAFTWGGGYAMLPLIKNEVVEKKGWISSEDFIDGIAVSQSLPGPIAINIATYVGHKLCGKLGSLMALAGAILPSFISILIIAMFFLRFRDLKLVQNFFKGANPAIVALIASAVIDIGKSALKRYRELIITMVLFLLLVYFKIHPILAILISAILGIILGEKR